MKRALLSVSLLSLVGVNACVTIRNGPACSVAGVLSAGGICSRLTTQKTNDLSFHEMIDLLEAQPERTCVPVPDFNICADNQSKGLPVKLPARGAAIIMPVDDWNNLKTALEDACREMGSHCSYETQQLLQKLQ